MSQTDIDRLAIVKEDLYENADYAAAGSLPKAQAYLTALTRLIDMIPQMASIGGTQGEEQRFDIQTLNRRLDEVRAFVTRRRNRQSAGFRLRGSTRMRLRYQWGDIPPDAINQQ